MYLIHCRIKPECMLTTDHGMPPLQIDKQEFKEIGYWLVDHLAEFFDTIESRPVSPGLTPAQTIQRLQNGAQPVTGESPGDIVKSATELLSQYSMLSGHPRFWGYIIGSGTQIGTLADLLAAAINANVGGWHIAPMATEIEKQTVRWIADWIRYSESCGGILVSGGAMANYVGFLTARRIKVPWEVRTQGLKAGAQLKVYCSRETHTWIQKAADLFGLGTEAINWIDTDADVKMDLDQLKSRIAQDRAAGHLPFLVIGTAGTVSSGVVDNLRGLADLCREEDLWFHVDGAYGAPAARLPECAEIFDGLNEADSIALDPHKWFYCPQEAGCVLVKEEQHLLDTFSYRPDYYHFDEYEEHPGINYYEYGLQNSRGFRALKVWMGLRQAGQEGMEQMIRHDFAMARLLYQIVDEADDFEAFQTSLSITTFQYVPDRAMQQEELNTLNERIMVALQNGGYAYVTNAVISGRYLLRACIVNFRTRPADIRSLPDAIRAVAAELPANQ